MIRRDCLLEDGQPGWVLVPQPEHARLAADLAREWHADEATDPRRAGGVSPPKLSKLPQPPEDFFTALAHHDDGWSAWEAAIFAPTLSRGHPPPGSLAVTPTPEIVPEDGRPRSFTEMPLDDTLAIWSRCVDQAESCGPFPAWLVAGHFSTMLAGGTGAVKPAAAGWLAGIASRRRVWSDAWQSVDPVAQTQRLADRLLALLQFFDALSLWLCCGAPTVDELETAPINPPPTGPSGQRFRAASIGGALRITRWPFVPAALDLTAACLRVPVRAYVHANDLLAAQESHVLRWKLTR